MSDNDDVKFRVDTWHDNLGCFGIVCAALFFVYKILELLVIPRSHGG